MSAPPRVILAALAPQPLRFAMNAKAQALDLLYYISATLRARLAEIPDMRLHLVLAATQAEAAHELQELAILRRRLLEQDSGRNSTHSGSSLTLSTHPGYSGALTPTADPERETIQTFAVGMLPVGADDPMTELWQLFKQGAPLCLVFNHVKPAQLLPVVLSDDLRVCKKSVYDFLLACRLHLGLEDEELFTILDLFTNSTDGFMKVVKVVTSLCNLSPSLTAVDPVQPPPSPQTPRDKVLFELVETERKYVQDMTALAAYRTLLLQLPKVLPELVHTLFPNLVQLLDFQRRFLNALEINYCVPAERQHLGSVFVHAQSFFRAYEPWCVGSKAAHELVEKEKNILDVGILNVTVDVPSFIIKPIQRLCKYPLLLKSLIKFLNPAEGGRIEVRDELADGLKAALATADLINELTRRQENMVLFQQLLGRVADWRGYDAYTFGELWLGQLLEVKDNGYVRLFVCYLFDEIVLFFNEGLLQSLTALSLQALLLLGKKKKNSREVLAPAPATADGDLPLELKGRIYILNIYKIQALPPAAQLWGNNPNPAHFLLVGWTGGLEAGVFVLRFPNEDVRVQFELMLRRVVGKHRAIRDSQQQHVAELTRLLVLLNGFLNHDTHDSRRSSAELVMADRRAALTRQYLDTYAMSGNAPQMSQGLQLLATAKYGLMANLSTANFSGLLGYSRSTLQPVYKHLLGLSTNTNALLILQGMQNVSLGLAHTTPLLLPASGNLMVSLFHQDEMFPVSILPKTPWLEWLSIAYNKLLPRLPEHIISGMALNFRYKDEEGDWVVLGGRDWLSVLEYITDELPDEGLCVTVM